MKYLSYEEIVKLPIGSVFYYEEYSPGLEKTVWTDIVRVVDHTEYSGPWVRVIFGMLNEIGDKGVPSFYEITNKRARATADKPFMIEIIFKSEK